MCAACHSNRASTTELFVSHDTPCIADHALPVTAPTFLHQPQQVTRLAAAAGLITSSQALNHRRPPPTCGRRVHIAWPRAHFADGVLAEARVTRGDGALATGVLGGRLRVDLVVGVFAGEVPFARAATLATFGCRPSTGPDLSLKQCISAEIPDTLAGKHTCCSR